MKVKLYRTSSCIDDNPIWIEAKSIKEAAIVILKLRAVLKDASMFSFMCTGIYDVDLAEEDIEKIILFYKLVEVTEYHKE